MELKDIFEKESFNVHLSTPRAFGKAASRVEIESVLTDNNISLPLQHSVSFTITDTNDKNFVIYYVKPINGYLVIKPKVV